MAELMMTCPHCGEGVKLPATVTESNHESGRVVLQLADNQDGGLAHLAECRRKPAELAPTVPQAELAGRVHRMLDMRAYVATGGSRACVLCGVKGQVCLEQLSTKGGAPCCAGCGNGDTHPVPQGTLSCAEWAASEHHPDGGR